MLRMQAISLALIAAICGAAVAQPATSSQAAGKLGRTIAAILADPAVARAHWGISVITPTGQVIYALNAGQSFEPASNAKLFTTATAFAVFLPDSHFTTKVVASSVPSVDGTLEGDIVIQGSGDPSISGRVWPYAGKTERSNSPLQVLEGFADQVAANHIHRVTGKVIGDDSLFPFERYGGGWGWDDLQWEYGAPISALTVNDNVIYLDLTPGARPGDPVTAAWRPNVPYYMVENTTVTGAAAPKPQLGLDRQPGARTLRLFGTLPVNSKGVHLALAIEDPAEFTALAFRQMLVDRGIAVDGPAAGQHRYSSATAEYLDAYQAKLTPPLPVGVSLPQVKAVQADTVLATHASPPLVEDLTVINKVSQNLHAELVLRDLGQAVLGDGSILGGARVIRQFLIKAGVDPGDFVFFDGSGLSPQDMITPRAATTLLAYAARQPWGEAFRETLPIAGVDGTLSNRFLQSPVKGKLLAKTGTLSEVNTLSGYLTAKSGKTVVLSILCNDHDPANEATRKAADRIIEAIYSAE
jgi:serine-type D-Ala-D-Ala carboxypeptidase/endopeptidase (penicillin-binding protein 4)